MPAAVIERLLGRREVPDQTEAHRVSRVVAARRLPEWARCAVAFLGDFVDRGRDVRGTVERAVGLIARPMLAGTRRCRVEGVRASRVAAPRAARCSITDAVAGALRRKDPCSSPRSCR